MSRVINQDNISIWSDSRNATLKLRIAFPGSRLRSPIRCKTELEELVDFNVPKYKDIRENRIMSTLLVIIWSKLRLNIYTYICYYLVDKVKSIYREHEVREDITHWGSLHFFMWLKCSQRRDR